jgi:TRAP transporter TAXI family solute receptor
MKANNMLKTIMLTFVSAVLWLQCGICAVAAEFKIVTASERGTYIQIGRDIATFVAPQADIELQVLPSAGSAENVRRLRYEPGVRLAIVQSDVYQAFLDLARRGNREAGDIIQPLRVIMPLYNEEIYFLARADSNLTYVHEIRDARLNAGELGSGTALTTSTLYRLMFGEALPDGRTTFLTNENALIKLIDDRTVDVVAVVAGQPAKLLADMKPEARQFIKLLRIDSNHPTTKAALQTYFPATVRATSYPNLLVEDVPAIAVRAFLVTYDYKLQQTKQSLARLAQSLCQNFSALQAKGHPKWREVDLSMPPLGRGWFYYGPTSTELRSCGQATPTKARRPTEDCSQHERILGLCG